MKKIQKAYIRINANERIGFGHFYRCLALVDYLKGLFDFTFVMEEFSTTVTLELSKLDCQTLEVRADEYLFLDQLKSSEVVIVDSYTYPDEFFKQIRHLGAKLIYIDDQMNRSIEADMIINHLIGAEKSSFYNNYENTALLLGPNFAIMRRAFFRESTLKGSIKFDLLICLGNSDVQGEATRLIALIGSVSQNPRIAFLGSKKVGEDLVNRFAQVEAFWGLAAEEVRDLISSTNYCLINPSTISYEVFSVGRPAIIGHVNKTQAQPARLIAEEGLALYAGDWGSLETFSIFEDKQRLHETVKTQNKLFDGKSAERIRNQVYQLCYN